MAARQCWAWLGVKTLFSGYGKPQVNKHIESANRKRRTSHHLPFFGLRAVFPHWRLCICMSLLARSIYCHQQSRKFPNKFTLGAIANINIYLQLLLNETCNTTTYCFRNSESGQTGIAL